MDSTTRLLRSRPDGPVFGRDLVADDPDVLVEWMRSADTWESGIRVLGIGSDPQDWLVLDLNPTTPDPRWREVLNTTKGGALYAIASSWPPGELPTS